MSFTRTQNKFSKGIDDRADDTAVTVDESGNVGLGIYNPTEKLTVGGRVLASSHTLPPDNAGAFGIMGASRMEAFDLETQKSLAFYADNTLVATMKDNGAAYFNGPVGIGMTPVTSTFDLSAKEQLKEWKTKAKKAPWTVVTDGAFEQEPTEELIAEWMETRAAGDALQVSGRVSFTNPESATRMLVLNASTQDPSAYRQAFTIQSSGTDMLYMVTGPASSLNSTTALSLATPTTSVTLDNVNDKVTFTGTVVANGPSNKGVPTTSIAPAILVNGGQSGGGEGGEVRFSAFNHANGFAAIKGYILDATPNTVGLLDFYTRKSVSDTDMTLAMRINNAGSVGIGTGFDSSVLAPLHVDGASSTGVAGYLRLQNETSNTGYTGVYFSADPTYAKQAIYAQRAAPNGGGSLIFAVDSNTDAADVAITDEKMRIDANGNVGINTGKLFFSPDLSTGGGWHFRRDQLNGECYIWDENTAPYSGPLIIGTTNTERMRIGADGRVDITGSLYVNGQAKIGTKELIETLSTLRAATQDETTLEGLRDSIGNAIGGLIEKFEAMQNEVGTMDLVEE